MSKINNIDNIIKRLDEYIEYAESVKRFADVSFYKEIQCELMKYYKINGTVENLDSRYMIDAVNNITAMPNPTDALKKLLAEDP